MASCANCKKSAAYEVENVGAPVHYFCKDHLPLMYNKDRLPTYVKSIEEELKEEENLGIKKESKPKKKAEAPKVETPVVEEAPVVEDAPAAVEPEVADASTADSN